MMSVFFCCCFFLSKQHTGSHDIILIDMISSSDKFHFSRVINNYVSSAI